MRQELERLLDTHRAQRPEMQPQDYYKLLYQREFGCGHTAVSYTHLTLPTKLEV